MGRNKINKNYTPKTSRTNNEKYHSNYGMNLNNKFIYKKVHTQRFSATFNKNTNLFLTTSLTTTRNQTNKNKAKKVESSSSSSSSSSGSDDDDDESESD